VVHRTCSHTSRTCPGSVGVPGHVLDQRFIWSVLLSFYERSLDHGDFSCSDGRSHAWDPSQDLAPLAQRSQYARGSPSDRCPHHLCGAGTPPGGGQTACTSPPGSCLCARVARGASQTLAGTRGMACSCCCFAVCFLRFSGGPDPETFLPGNQDHDPAGAARPTRPGTAQRSASERSRLASRLWNPLCKHWRVGTCFQNCKSKGQGKSLFVRHLGSVGFCRQNNAPALACRL